MLEALALLLALQLVGEVIVLATALPIPGPVVGMLLLLGGLLLRRRLPLALQSAAEALLNHLPLLFVPAGVGIIRFVDRLYADAWAILLALVLSTLFTIAVTALLMAWTARLLGHGSAGEANDAE